MIFSVLKFNWNGIIIKIVIIILLLLDLANKMAPILTEDV